MNHSLLEMLLCHLRILLHLLQVSNTVESLQDMNYHMLGVAVEHINLHLQAFQSRLVFARNAMQTVPHALALQHTVRLAKLAGGW